MAEQPSGEDGLDLAGVRTWDDLLQRLRMLHAAADRPSTRDLQRWARRHHKPPLAPASQSEVLTGKKRPSKAFLLTFAEGCGVTGPGLRAWEDAWTRVVYLESAAAPGPRQPAAETTWASGTVPAAGRGRRPLLVAAAVTVVVAGAAAVALVVQPWRGEAAEPAGAAPPAGTAAATTPAPPRRPPRPPRSPRPARLPPSRPPRSPPPRRRPSPPPARS
ncbi:hypothetical protein MF672_033570 [Actinomadura sp. ATCC 31491]|uniref:Uncharacterized protein n=1 Tax=Actinomadura luzonensis TaxID=2805427 RepID=A0ABT0G275_9ACTN|nr:hypothetical protein [Actinomadura luzonensis]MCK2218689.1 hypothetical protein [Actinomadura luzonensis]